MKWIFATIFFWLVFVLSLAGWWLYFGMNLLSRSTAIENEKWARHQKMLFYEGSFLMLFLVSGGLALFYFAYRMYKEKSAKEMFFASFTHDLKTGLFRLQLEVERLGKTVDENKIEPLLKETRKLQLDLENSLDSTLGEKKKIYLEAINVKNFLQEIHAQWPELSIHLSGEEQIHCDQKALQSVFKNLLHNSFVHASADQVKIDLKRKSSNIVLDYSDNGTEFQGDVEQLGQFNKTSGSGFGLYIVRQWVKLLNGEIDFKKKSTQSLSVQITLPQGSLK